ncbi:MAG: hypothetical protein GX758_00765 [Tenericutes bacterium]|nr:hypothetical protein [Mycoplasmatota bacterium]
MKKNLITLIIIIIAIVGTLVIYYFVKDDNNDKIKITNSFYNEYPLVEKDNIFVYKSIDEIIKLLESGTGIIYLGFPECPWCQHYVKYLNEVAKENNIKEIYYLNIKNDRLNNTIKYQKIVSLLYDNLLNDDLGNKKVFVPDITFVKEGKIIAHDNETSVITENTTPSDYWNNDKIETFKLKLNKYFHDLNSSCESCN